MALSLRNAPCWCGSGKKFKRCHLGREGRVRPNIYEVWPAFRKPYETKVCLHPEAPKDCKGKLIRAHTVRRSADLRRVARDGHVYQGSIDIRGLVKAGGRIIPRLIGVNEASTFYGFCQHHDTEMFLPIENRLILPDDEQAFLLSYRPLLRELYLKKRHLEGTQLWRTLDAGLPLVEQMALQEFLHFHRHGVESAIYDLEHYKRLFDGAFTRRNFCDTRFIAIHLDRRPDIVCSGVTQPDFSFDGKRIQHLVRTDLVLDQIAFSILAEDGSGIAVFSWLKESDESCQILADSLMSININDLPAALVRFCLSELENCFLNPQWWESLPEITRESLIDRINIGIHPFEASNRNCLVDDGIRSVDWKVARIEQRRS